jgi:type VI secretion system protein ImpH
MAPAKRTTPSFIEESLQQRPFDFDFFQAVRRLESLRPQSPRVGSAGRPADDVLRFEQHVSLGFAPSTVHAYVPGDGETADRLAVNFFGLLGPNGPLPLSFTEYVYERLHNRGDTTLARFIDLFNHRMLSLFYRAWASAQQTVSHDRPEDDWFARYISSLVGQGEASFQDRDEVSDEMKRYYAGHLACPTRHAEGLEQLLEDYLGNPITIHEFVGQWIDLDMTDRCQLGARMRPPAALGIHTVLGTRIWECQQRFRIRIGPMAFPDYEGLLPGGRRLQKVVAWVQRYIGCELSWELQLVLKAESIPTTCLGRFGSLGWSTWVCSHTPAQDADEFILRDPSESHGSKGT